MPTATAPPPVRSGTMGREQLDRDGVAALLDVSPATISTYLVRAKKDPDRHPFPEPDGVIGRSPWWWSTTITKWQRKRPGQGAGAGRPVGATPVPVAETSSFDCPTCGAIAPHGCFAANGTTPIRHPHPARRQAALDARGGTQ